MLKIEKITLLVLSLALCLQSTAQDVYFPEFGEWEEKSPIEMSVKEEKLKAAIDFAIQEESDADKNLKKAHYLSAFGREPLGFPVGPMKDRGEAAGLIIYKGYVIGKWGDPERVDLTFSVAKSILSTTVGIAVDKGLIKSEKDYAYKYLGPIIPYDPQKAMMNKSDHLEEEDIFDLFGTTHNRKITWEHLLRQTSDWEGTLWGKPDWADRPQGNSSEWLTRERNEPGTVYKYNDTRVNVLALAALNVWRKPLPQVLKEHVMDPIGASPTWRWTGYENSFIVLDGQIVQSVSGGSHWGGGLFISTYDQARFGYLTLRKGNWNGKQIISEDWIRKSRTPTSVQPNYGFMNYFLNTDKKEIPAAPESAFFHLGAGTNMVYVDEENDLVIVARWIKNEKKSDLVKLVLESLPNPRN
ncbi:Beta-lactamase class C and other penicillin binding protein [Indibacter alkaliphilus LW1]|uniref:Beta-lactamase class C and other penicillin binding protein n=1 Tax=Indibacter alkaliphilus (strain CCUG 57479 / KCTC 22604 / LW1) TaxID=1189612 RepID=S2DHQ2_INDAL|nr:serine hydrolase [Indibacter alkaliphilus]EOZ98542.1 Beta-lactamase class C and other penicillin binding protein [Indibacter alkaliphilus LW1]